MKNNSLPPHDLRAVPHGRNSARITAQTLPGKEWLRARCGLSAGHYPAGLIVPMSSVWRTLNEARDVFLIVETGEAVAENFADTPSRLGELFDVFRDIYSSPSRALRAFAP